MQWFLPAVQLYRDGTTVLVSLSQTLRRPTWWSLGVRSALRSCLFQICPVLSSRSIWDVFWGTPSGAEWYKGESEQEGAWWEENCKAFQSYTEEARQKGVKRLFCDQKNAYVCSAFQKLHWELLTAVVVPWSWHRSPLMYNNGFIWEWSGALNILSSSNPQQPPVTWQLNWHSVPLSPLY